MYWKDGQILQKLPTLVETRNRVQESLGTLRNDIKRNLNPTPYKVITIFRSFITLIFCNEIFMFYRCL
jgi:hypothetical protein